MGINDGQRIAKLETRADNMDDKVDDVTETLHEIKTEVQAIRVKMEKNISFMGGIAFTFSLMGAAFATMAGMVLRKLGVIL